MIASLIIWDAKNLQLSDAEEVDLDLHLHRAALFRPSSNGELIRLLVERIYSRPLPGNRALWDALVIEELDHDRFATLLRLHYSSVEGSSGLDLLSAIHDPVAHAAEPSGKPVLSEELPGGVSFGYSPV